jgi:hypothetical protein
MQIRLRVLIDILFKRSLAVEAPRAICTETHTVLDVKHDGVRSVEVEIDEPACASAQQGH